MTPERYLWWKRFGYEWRQRYQMIRLSVDWVIALYVIVPVLVVGGVFYWQWLHEPPEWLRPELAGLASVLLIARALMTRVNPYVNAADIPTFTGMPFASRCFVARSFAWAYAKESVVWLCVLWLLYPLWHTLAVMPTDVWVWWVTATLFQWTMLNVDWLLLHMSRLLSPLVKVLIFVLTVVTVGGEASRELFARHVSLTWLFLIICALCALTAVGVVRQRRWDWLRLVTRTEKARNANTLLLGIEQETVIGRWWKKPLPWMRRQLGGPFTAAGALTEWHLKRFVRTQSHAKFFYQVFFVSFGGLWVAPSGWFRLFVFCFVAWLLTETFVMALSGERPLRQRVLPVSAWDAHTAAVRAYQWLLVPALTLLLIPTGISVVPWYGWLSYPFIAYIFGKWLLSFRLQSLYTEE